MQNMIVGRNGKGEGEKENVAQNAKDILPDDSRGTVPVMFDFARREKFPRLQTVVWKIVDAKKRFVRSRFIYESLKLFFSLTRVYPSRSLDLSLSDRERWKKKMLTIVKVNGAIVNGAIISLSA